MLKKDISGYFIIKNSLVYNKEQKLYTPVNVLEIPDKCSKFYENGVLFLKNNNIIEVIDTEYPPQQRRITEVSFCL